MDDGASNTHANWLAALRGKRFLLSAFRVSALAAATLELAFSQNEYIYVPWTIPVIGASLYTGFKLAHPLRWYQSTVGGGVLMAIDVMVAAALVLIRGQIHIPFALYTLAPVLTSALLLRRSATLIVAGVTGTYYTAVIFSYSLPEAVAHLNLLFTYLAALSLTAALPYITNLGSKQQLRSRAMVEERLRLAREIHDGLCQTIYGLRWQVQLLLGDAKGLVAEKLWEVDRLLVEAEKETRGSIESLHAFRSERPFLSQMEGYLERFEADSGIECVLDAPSGEPGLDELVKLEVLCIAEEALRNVAKHAEARHVTVSVSAIDGRLQVNIADDGRGFESGMGSGNGHGLTIMKERAEALGGRLEVNSSREQGTVIQVEVPSRCPPELPTSGQ